MAVCKEEKLNHKDENGKKYLPVYLRSVNSQLNDMDILSRRRLA